MTRSIAIFGFFAVTVCLSDAAVAEKRTRPSKQVEQHNGIMIGYLLNEAVRAPDQKSRRQNVRSKKKR